MAKLSILGVKGGHCFQVPSCEHQDRIPRPLGSGTSSLATWEFWGKVAPDHGVVLRLGRPPLVCLWTSWLSLLGTARSQNCCIPWTWGPGPWPHSHALLWSGALLGYVVSGLGAPKCVGGPSRGGRVAESGAGALGKELGSGWLHCLVAV